MAGEDCLDSSLKLNASDIAAYEGEIINLTGISITPSVQQKHRSFSPPNISHTNYCKSVVAFSILDASGPLLLIL